MAVIGREGCALNYLPIVPKAFVYVPKVMCKPVMGGNTVSETFTHITHVSLPKCVKFRKVAQAAKSEGDGWVWEGRAR